MDHDQQELRNAANKAFMDSLEELEKTLGCDRPPPAPPVRSQQKKASPPPLPPPINLEALEAAAADIEQYMNAQHRPQSVED